MELFVLIENKIKFNRLYNCVGGKKLYIYVLRKIFLYLRFIFMVEIV